MTTKGNEEYADMDQNPFYRLRNIGVKQNLNSTDYTKPYDILDILYMESETLLSKWTRNM